MSDGIPTIHAKMHTNYIEASILFNFTFNFRLTFSKRSWNLDRILEKCCNC